MENSSNLISQLRNSVDAEIAATWLDPLQLEETDDEIRITCPNTYFRKLFKQKFHKSLSELVRKNGITKRILYSAGSIQKRAETKVPASKAKTVKPFVAAEAVIAKRYVRVVGSKGGPLIFWDAVHGVFSFDEHVIWQDILELVGPSGTTGLANSIMDAIHMSAPIQDPQGLSKPANGFIPFLNGLFDAKLNAIVPHTSFPSHQLIASIPHEYRPDSTCPAIDGFLKEVLREEDLPLFEELAGYLLIPSCWLQKFFCLVGSGANGKSVSLGILEAMLGKRNYTALSLIDLFEQRFGRAATEGKLANIMADLDPRTIERTGSFKAWVSGDCAMAERKGKDAYSMGVTARLVYSTNSVPIFHEHGSQAIRRRLVILEFPNQFMGNKADPYLLQKLVTGHEIEGFIVQHAIPGLRRLFDNRRFTISENSERLIGLWAEESDTVLGWIRNNLIPGTETIEFSDLWNDYQNYIEIEQIPRRSRLGRTSFYRHLEHHLFKEGTVPGTFRQLRRCKYLENIEIVKSWGDADNQLFTNSSTLHTEIQ